MIKKYEAYKECRLEWIDNIPSNWNLLKIGRTFNNIGSGTTPKSTEKQFYENGTINWLNTGDLNDSYIYSTNKKITLKAIENNSTLRIFPAESIVIALYGATIGKLGYLKIETTTNQACCVLSNSEKVDQRFLFYYFLAVKEFIISKSYGGGQPNISQDLIKQLYIATPLISEQTQITAYLDYQTGLIDAIIEKKELLIQKLKAQRQAIINEAVTKGVTSSGVEKPNAPMKDSGIEWLGEIPEHWEVVKLKFLGESITGITYSPDDVKEDGLLVLRSSNIQNGELSLNDTVYVQKEVNQKYIVQLNDILLCSRNGSRNLIGKNIMIDQRVENQTWGAFMTVFRSEFNDFLYFFFIFLFSF